MSKAEKILVGLLSAVFLGVLLFAQEHATVSPDPVVTQEQCNAYRAEWGTEDKSDWLEQDGRQVITGETNHNPVQRLNLDNLTARIGVSSACLKLEQGQGTDPRITRAWVDFADFYKNVYTARENHFIRRHGLWKQFYDEDMAGVR